MENEHWSTTFEHDTLAEPAVRESLTKAMGKYETPEAAVLGNYELQKVAGKPFKLPESIDKIPEAQREEFTASARKVLGMEGVKSVEDLADLNFKDGLADNIPIEAELSESFKEFVVENKVSKAGAQKLVGFYNKLVTKAVDGMKNQMTEAAANTNEALVKHFGSEEAVTEKSELVKR